jgi:hypothetical protein
MNQEIWYHEILAPYRNAFGSTIVLCITAEIALYLDHICVLALMLLPVLLGPFCAVWYRCRQQITHFETLPFPQNATVSEKPVMIATSAILMHRS